ncbi:MAG TPA: glycoside hydrolase family 3 C-terminal domain-containing protein, partial [Sphingobacteriaceae bacterium]
RSTVKTVAVIGQDAVEARLGGYSGPGNSKVSILDGLKARGDRKILFAKGVMRAPQELTIVPGKFLSHGELNGLQAEYFTNVTLEGKPTVVKSVDNIDFLWTLASPDEAIPSQFYSARWTGKITSPKPGKYKIGLEGNDGFRLYVDNTLVIDQWSKQSYHTRLVDVDFAKGQWHDIRIEFYEPVGNARIRLIWTVESESNEDAAVREAVALASQADVAVVVAGIHEGEFQDRAYLSLPGRQEELINQVAATGKPIVVVLVGGSAITMSNWLENVDAVVDVWYPGEEGGHAVADVLTGAYNPAGRLPISFPIHEAQLPYVYNHKPTGRGDDYHNLTGLPLFPFGYGLSYTTFTYSNIRLDKYAIEKTGNATLSFEVTNTGNRAGEEVCQLYIKDVLASMARPVQELKGFTRVALQPGETKTVRFTITPALLAMLDTKLKLIVEPGDFRLMIGSSSRDIRLQSVLTVR